MTDLAPADQTDELSQLEQWLDMISKGTPPLNAGVELGWTPRQVRDLCKQAEVIDLITMAQNLADGTVVKAMYDQAVRGNMTAIQTWLFNRRPEEWKDIKRVVVSGDLKVETSTIIAAKEAAKELLAAANVVDLQRMVEANASGPVSDE